MSRKIRTKLTEEEINEIIRLYCEGKSLNQIKEKFNITKGAIWPILKRKNITFRHKNFLWLSEEERKEIIRKYNKGLGSETLAKEYNCCHETILKFLKKNGVEIRHLSDAVRQYPVDETYFDNVNTQEKAYFLGFLYMDGCNLPKTNTVRLHLQARDKEILEKLTNLIQPGKPLYFLARDGAQDTWILNITSKLLCKKLEELGCAPRKSFTLIWPEWLDKSLWNHFLRGCMDGNGSFGNPPKPWVSLTSTDMFCNKVSEILKLELDIESRIISHATSVGISTLHIRHLIDMPKFITWLYLDSTISLERKKLTAEKILKYRPKSLYNELGSPLTPDDKIERRRKNQRAADKRFREKNKEKIKERDRKKYLKQKLIKQNNDTR